jgi:aspartokinase
VTKSMSPEERRLRAPPPQRGNTMESGYSADVSARLEAMVGVDPRTTLDKLRAAQEETSRLRAQAAEVKAKLAMYEARYAYPSHWEHERKALLSRLASHERDRVQSRGEKVTESYLDEYAHSHDEYRSFLREAKRERERMEDLRAELSEIHGKIETAEGVETYYERHARLNDSLVYHSGREIGLS